MPIRTTAPAPRPRSPGRARPTSCSSVGPTAAAAGGGTAALAAPTTPGRRPTQDRNDETIGWLPVGAQAPPSDAPPVVALAVTPASGPPPLTVTANASGSTDTDATAIANYKFTFGDGSSAVGPQTSPAA